MALQRIVIFFAITTIALSVAGFSLLFICGQEFYSISQQAIDNAHMVHYFSCVAALASAVIFFVCFLIDMFRY